MALPKYPFVESSGAVLVEVYGPPSHLVSGAADELHTPSLPTLVDVLCDPLPSARARLCCLANFALCGSCDTQVISAPGESVSSSSAPTTVTGTGACMPSVWMREPVTTMR